MLISIHIPKTAGTAWRLMIEANAARYASFASVEARDRDDAASRALALLDAGQDSQARSLIEGSGTQLIHGHRADAFLKIFPDAPVILWLRDPMQRLLSEYMHLKTIRREESKRQSAVHAGTVSLKAFARTRGQVYTRLEAQLGDHPGGYIAMLTERSELAVQALHAALGWRGQLARRNVAPKMSSDGIDALIDGKEKALEDLIAGDRRIHSEWCQRWDSGEAGENAQELLLAGPRRQPLQLRQYLRRLAGIGKEKLGRSLGRDWR